MKIKQYNQVEVKCKYDFHYPGKWVSLCSDIVACLVWDVNLTTSFKQEFNNQVMYFVLNFLRMSLGYATIRQ